MNFYIYSEEEYDQAERLIEDNFFSNKITDIKPLFNNKNVDFFENNIFMDNEDVNEIELSKMQIFKNQSINPNYFGRLILSSNGFFYSNILDDHIGTIEEDIRSIIYHELVNGRSWFRIRDFKPCLDCVYQWLCPPPSNYELVLGKPNFCHLK